MKMDGQKHEETTVPADEHKTITVVDLSERFNASVTATERIDVLYEAGQHLVRNALLHTDVALPMDEMRLFASLLISMLEKKSFDLKYFFNRMPHVFEEAANSVNVSILSALLAHTLNYTRRQLEDIALAGLLHDIGKCRIDHAILDKTGQLSDEEYEEVQKHVEHSVGIAKNNQIHNVRILSAIQCHHERLDGSGYPRGLAGNQIPAMAQIIAIADVFDALTTDRTYRPKYSSFAALKLMKQEMHHQFNVQYIDQLIKQFAKL